MVCLDRADELSYGKEMEHLKEESARYLELAQTCSEQHRLCLVAVGGLSGSGKSSVAARLAPALKPIPGALIIRSDWERKVMAGVEFETPLPSSTYSLSSSDEVYEHLRQKAAAALGAGMSVIVDAVHLKPEDRAAIAACAREAGALLFGFWLQAGPEQLKQRISDRQFDASDADADVLKRQLQMDPRPLDWTVITNDTSLESAAEQVRQFIGRAI